MNNFVVFLTSDFFLHDVMGKYHMCSSLPSSYCSQDGIPYMFWFSAYFFQQASAPCPKPNWLSELAQLSQKRSLSFTAGIPHGRTAELCPNRHSSEHLHSEVPRMFHVASMEIDSLNSLLRARCQVRCSWVLH